jgi:decaprenylphosphoryl-5-phosphoribose phosphatase
VARFARIGDHGGVWLALGLGGAVFDGGPGRRRRRLRAVATIAGAYAINQTVKILVRRPRPDLPGAGQLSRMETQLSFPSAHATTSLCGARVLSDAGMARSPLYALAAALVGSRLYLGVHYPSDVLAGAALGDVLGRAATR